MTKDRPFKNYKTPAERPFKTYNPIRSSMLFEDYQQQQQQSQQSQQQQQQQQQQVQVQQQQVQQQQQQQQLLPQQSLRLNSMSALLQQQQQQQAHMFSTHQQQQQQPSSSSNQQVYGDPEDFIHLSAQQSGPNPIMNIDPSINPYYEDLGLDDPENALIRPDLLVTNDSLLQREQDLNIPNTSAPPNFILPTSRLNSLMRAPPSSTATSMQDSLSMLFEQPQQPTSLYSTTSTSAAPSVSPVLQQHQQLLMSKPGGEANRPIAPIANHYMSAHNQSLPDNIMGSLSNIPTPSSNGRSRLGSNGMNPSPSFPVKQEADEGHSRLVESPSPSVQSPSQSDPSDSYLESPKTGIKRSLSEGGSSSETKHSEGDTSDSCLNKGDASRDPLYLEKRRKNNESAKRSREARRSKEELVALRVITLEEENMKLRAEISLLDKELEELRNRLFS